MIIWGDPLDLGRWEVTKVFIYLFFFFGTLAGRLEDVQNRSSLRIIGIHGVRRVFGILINYPLKTTDK